MTDGLEVKKMEHKVSKISMSSALLVVAMISLVGVGFAITYSGSATTDTTPSSGETITVTASKTGFEGGIYTLDSANDGTNFALSNPQRWDSVSDTTGDAVSLASKYFAYSAGAFSLTDVASGYKCAQIGQITVGLKQTDGAQANAVTLTTSGAETGTANQYGMSLVYTYSVNGGTETVVADPNTAQAVAMTSGSGSVVLTAYLVYSESVPVASQASLSAFTVSSATVTFTAEASYSA